MKAYRHLGLVLYWLLRPLLRVVLRRSKRVYIALVHDGQVCAVKNWMARDTWRLPGGGMKAGETPAETAKREIREELGFHVSTQWLTKLIEGVQTTDGLGFFYTVFAYQLEARPTLRANRYELTATGWINTVAEDFDEILVLACQELQRRKMV